VVDRKVHSLDTYVGGLDRTFNYQKAHKPYGRYERAQNLPSATIATH